VQRFPEIPFVLDHIAKPPFAASDEGAMRTWEDGIRELASSSSKLVCKVSGLVTEADWHSWQAEDFTAALTVVEDAFGRERLLYGSDWPVCLLATKDYAEIHDLVDDWASAWSDDERRGFFGANARAFYGL
jgi:L-fuconolactonase